MKLEHPKAPKWRQAGRKLATTGDMSFSGKYPESVCSLVSLTDSRGPAESDQVQLCSYDPLLDVHLQSTAQLLE